MKKVTKTARNIVFLPLTPVVKLVSAIRHERHMRKIEKEQEELMLGYDSPLLYPTY